MKQETTHQSSHPNLSNRVEGVSTALYLVTHHLSDREPLKTKIRTLAFEIIELSIGQGVSGYSDLKTQFDVIGSLLRVAYQTRIISETNAQFVMSEIDSIKDIIHQPLPNDQLGVQLQNLFKNYHLSGIGQIEQGVPGRSTESVVAPTPIPVVNKPASTVLPPHNTHLNTGGAVTSAKATVQHLVDRPKQAPVVKEGVSDRQANIIKEIKSKGQLTIRDLVDKISGCSEKTIQRELLSMVDQGILKKEGERRWSRYSLVS